MPLTRDQELQFESLTRHLHQQNLDVHLKMAYEQVENGLRFTDKAEATAFLRSAAFLHDIRKAAIKYPDELQTRFKLEPDQLKSCISIMNQIERTEIQKTQGPEFFAAKSTRFGKQAFEKLFMQFTEFLQKKTPK